MIYHILQQYKNIIESFEIKTFYHAENTYSLSIEFLLIRNYKLFVKDYCFLDGSRKYAYHFQDDKDNLIFRYDNAPHWNTLGNFPHHKHISDKIEMSKTVSVEDIFSEIEHYLL